MRRPVLRRLLLLGLLLSGCGKAETVRADREVPAGLPDDGSLLRLPRGGGAAALYRADSLVPLEWRHPSKEFLTAWYGRRGYRLVATSSVERAYPHLAPFLATPCELQIHRKSLR